MPLFRFELRKGSTISPDDSGLDLPDLHQAYLEACRAIPDMARDMLIERIDPLECAFLICDAHGRRLLEVRFDEVLSPRQWRRRRPTRGPLTMPRSLRSRDNLAAHAFQAMFAQASVGIVLLTPDACIREINAFGARQSHVDPDAVRDAHVLDVYNPDPEARTDFAAFWSLAQTGMPSELIDMPYVMLNPDGETSNGWWNARVWPIHHDDGSLVGLAALAEPFLHPTAAGRTIVRVTSGLPR